MGHLKQVEILVGRDVRPTRSRWLERLGEPGFQKFAQLGGSLEL
jgi:hypothetical protein